MNTEDKTIYLHLVTDTYSKQIMDYKLSMDLSAESTQKALQMALSTRIYPERSLMHHSDRGLQYCSAAYMQGLRDHRCQVGMAEDGSPYAIAVAERLNGLLNDEFYCDETFESYEHSKRYVDQAIMIYNPQRPLTGCSMLIPLEMHRQDKLCVKKWNKKKPLCNLQSGSK